MQFKFSTVLGVATLFLPALATALTVNDTALALDDTALTFDDVAADMFGDCSCGFKCIRKASKKIGCPDIKCTCRNVEKMTKPVEKCIKKKCSKQLACALKVSCKFCPGPRKCTPKPPSPLFAELDGEEDEFDEEDDMPHY